MLKQKAATYSSVHGQLCIVMLLWTLIGKKYSSEFYLFFVDSFRHNLAFIGR
jgi:hypothetical protein